MQRLQTQFKIENRNQLLSAVNMIVRYFRYDMFFVRFPETKSSFIVMSICLPVLNNQLVVGLRYCAAYTPLLETLVEVYEEALTRCTITNEKLGDKCGVIPKFQEILKSSLYVG